MSHGSPVYHQSQTPSPKPQYDVAIIGGGLSGLAAAVDLASRGAEIILLEQSSKLGGRCYSYIDETTGDVVDNGQHVLVGAYRHTLRYLEMIGTRKHLRAEPKLRLPLYHPEKGFAVFEVASLPKPLHLTAGMLKFKLLTLSERRRLLSVGLALQKWNKEMEQRLSQLTVDEWLTSLHQSDEAKRCLWFPIAISIMNELPQHASALLFARSLRATFLGSKSDARILIPTIGQTELYVDSAITYLSERSAKIMLNAEVTSTEIVGPKVIGVQMKDGSVIKSTSVISSVPYHALVKLLPNEALNYHEFSSLHKLQSSPIVSIHLWFDKEFMPMDYIGLIDKNIQWLFNRRRIAKDKGTPACYLAAVISGAYEQVGWTKEHLIDETVKDIGEVFPESQTSKLLHSVVIKEKRATFSPTSESESFRPSVRTSLTNFYLAGDWTATGLPATIEGAIMSGFAASKEAFEFAIKKRSER